MGGLGNVDRSRRSRAHRSRIRTAAQQRRFSRDAGGRNGVAVQHRRGGSDLAPKSFRRTGNSPMNSLVFVLVAVVGSATSRYGSAPTARSNMFDPSPRSLK